MSDPKGAKLDPEEPALVLDRVSHAYDDLLAVDDLSLAIAAGELVCLLGPSGCGKTTALRIAAGLEHLQQGRVILAGRVVAGERRDIPPEERNIGLVFQDYALFPHLSVRANVGFGLNKLPARERRSRVDQMLAQVGMDTYAEAYPHQLSGGQQQRVALARALAPQPPVMLLDEPFSGLDQALRNQVRDQTLHVLKKSGAATLMVTHDPEEAMFMADRVALMRDGKIVQCGQPSELYLAPRDAFVASFFGEVNRLPGVVLDGRVQTPFGWVRAEDHAEGAQVDVLIRPEALILRPIGPGCRAGERPAHVLASRMLGRSSMIHLSVHGAHGDHLHLHARIPGRHLPAEDEVMAVELDRSQAFVFPATRGRTAGPMPAAVPGGKQT
jgi:iron(III) transport system ATP-binding protein